MIRSEGLEPNSDKFHEITYNVEPYINRIKRSCKKVISNLTLEPVLFFMSFVGSMDSASVSQLLIDKSCNIDFDFPEGVCDDLLSDNNTASNDLVSDEVAQFKVYESIVDHLFPIIVSFFLGSWSDTFGRKVILYVFFTFRLVEGSFLLLNAYFMEWPKEYLLFSVNLPVALSGGYLAYSMGINAFIADISKPEQRSFRMAMIHFVSSLGRPFGTQIGAVLFEQGGYVCVIGATLLGRLVSFGLLILSLEMFKWSPKKKEEESDEPIRKKRHHALSPSHIIDSLKTAVKPRSDGKRFYLWVYLLVMISMVLPWFGESVIGYLYVQKRYNWGVQEYSDFRTVSEVLDIVGQAIFIPVLGVLQIKDSLIIPILLSTVIARDFVKGFAETSWLYYFGSAINVMGGYSFAACRSIISKCVESHELGKVFALLAALESLVPIGMSQAYASIWALTSVLDSLWVGSVFFLSGAITSISLILSLISLLSLKGRAISDLGKASTSSDLDARPIKRPHYSMIIRGQPLERRVATGNWTLPPQIRPHWDTFDCADCVESTDSSETNSSEEYSNSQNLESVKTISGEISK